MYVDGFVVPVKTARKDDYLRISKDVAEIFLEFGASRVVEGWGNDVPDGEVTSFPMAVKLEDDETALFSWVEWPDKATRDAGMAKVMADPRMAKSMPDDVVAGKRMIFGGFELILDERDET